MNLKSGIRSFLSSAIYKDPPRLKEVVRYTEIKHFSDLVDKLSETYVVLGGISDLKRYPFSTGTINPEGWVVRPNGRRTDHRILELRTSTGSSFTGNVPSVSNHILMGAVSDRINIQIRKNPLITGITGEGYVLEEPEEIAIRVYHELVHAYNFVDRRRWRTRTGKPKLADFVSDYLDEESRTRKPTIRYAEKIGHPFYISPISSIKDEMKKLRRLLASPRKPWIAWSIRSGRDAATYFESSVISYLDMEFDEVLTLSERENVKDIVEKITEGATQVDLYYSLPGGEGKSKLIQANIGLLPINQYGELLFKAGAFDEKNRADVYLEYAQIILAKKVIASRWKAFLRRDNKGEFKTPELYLTERESIFKDHFDKLFSWLGITFPEKPTL